MKVGLHLTKSEAGFAVTIFFILLYSLLSTYALLNGDRVFGCVFLAVAIFYSCWSFRQYRNKPPVVVKREEVVFGKGTVMQNEFSAPIRKMYFPVEITNGEKKKTVLCLIDTGATGSLHIQKSIADELGLSVVGEGKCFTVAHEIDVNFHRVNLKLGNTHFKNIEIESTAKILSGNEYEQGIIGMDVLSHGILMIKREGEKFKYHFEI